MNIIGLPYYLWNLENAVSLAEEVGESFVEANKECIGAEEVGHVQGKDENWQLEENF